MTDKQENKRSMYLAVQKVCINHNSVWSALPAFVTAFTDFKNNNTAIDAQRQIQEGKIIGVTQNKKKEEEEMIQITIEVAAAVYAYASDNSDNELRKKVDYSPSYLANSRDTQLKDICQLIHDEANNLIANLANYGLTAADLAQQQKEIDDFVAIIAKPRTAIGTKSTATSQLVKLFEKGDDALKNRLDKLIENYKKPKPDFYKAYHSARIIIDLGKGPKSEENANPVE